MILRIDPWDPEYGGSIELEPEAGEPAGLDFTAEVAGEWAPIDCGARTTLPCCAFIDGVRRIEARLFAQEGEVTAAALAGSWAVGCAWSTRPPQISDVRVGRELVVGSHLSPDPLAVPVGAGTLHFAPRSEPGATPMDPLQGLQNAMRAAEAQLASDTLARGRADLVVCDGPLTYFSAGPAVGMIKRQARSYLDAPRTRVLSLLAVGERTPIFTLGEQRLERYAWYLRLAARRPIDGEMASIVRLEVATEGGLRAARDLAQLTGAILPRFAPRPGQDPRAPQNLHPISALEGVLRHRLGDGALVRRALEARIYEEVRGVG